MGCGREKVFEQKIRGGCGMAAHGERVKAFLAGSVPDLISEHAVFEAAFLCEESGADGRLFVGLEFVGDLRSLIKFVGGNDGTRIGHTKRRTTDDLPTAASPARRSESIGGTKGSKRILSKEDELNLNGLVGGTGSSVGHEASVGQRGYLYLVSHHSLSSSVLSATMRKSGNLFPPLIVYYSNKIHTIKVLLSPSPRHPPAFLPRILISA